MCLKDIGMCIQHTLVVLNSLVNISGWGLCEYGPLVEIHISIQDRCQIAPQLNHSSPSTFVGQPKFEVGEMKLYFIANKKKIPI